MQNMQQNRTISRLTLKVADGCNLCCSYCFADNSNTGGRFVTDEDFAYFMAFCLRNGIRGIRMTGGEPTLHPNLHRYIHLSVRAGLPVHLFSNFTVPGWVGGLHEPPRAVSFLVNINDRESYSTAQWEALTDNLAVAAARNYKVIPAYTVHSVPFSISHIVAMARQYRYEKIRISPAKPVVDAGNSWLKPEEMTSFAHSVRSLHQEATAIGIQPVLDCPVPLCQIPAEHLGFFLQELRLTGICSFGISVDVGLEVGHCYITNPLLKRRQLQSFSDLQQLQEYLAAATDLIENSCPLLPECPTCTYYTLGVCKAGCYGVRHVLSGAAK